MSLTALVSTVFNFLLMVAGLAAFIMIIWGGINYLTSAGDPSKTRDAKKQVFAAILGLIILFSAWIILNSINPELVNIREPVAGPPPAVQPPAQAVEPTPETPAAFYYIPLGKVIDDVVLQEKTTLPKMREFADLALQCSRDLCDGDECEYWVSEPCPEEETPEEESPPAETPPSDEGGWNWENWDWGTWYDWLFYLVKLVKPPFIYAQEDCGHWETCSAPCNTNDPCPPDKKEAIDKISPSTDKMEKEISKLQQGKQKISSCITDEDAILLSCQEVLDMFRPSGQEEPLPQWETIKNCRQGYDFYCVYGEGEDVVLDKIILPFETIRESIESIRELERVVSSCDCSNCSFCCECCAACSGVPCPSETYDASASAIEAVNELGANLQKLEETVAEVAGLSAADEIVTLTCSEAYSWLKSIKEGGCPSIKAFPCCPVDAETEKTIRNCQIADFFFCSAP